MLRQAYNVSRSMRQKDFGIVVHDERKGDHAFCRNEPNFPQLSANVSKMKHACHRRFLCLVRLTILEKLSAS